MIPLALVHTKEAFDFIGIGVLVSGGWFSWNRISAKEKQRRIERLEKQAEYARRHLRWDRESAEALRCRGGVVR